MQSETQILSDNAFERVMKIIHNHEPQNTQITIFMNDEEYSNGSLYTSINNTTKRRILTTVVSAQPTNQYNEPNIPKNIKTLIMIGIGSNDVFDHMKITINHIISSNQKINIIFVLIPNSINTGSEINNIALLKHNGLFYKPYLFKQLNNARIKRVIILDPNLLLETKIFYAGIRLTIHGIDFSLVPQKTGIGLSSLIHQLCESTTPAINSSLKLNYSLNKIIQIPILQRLSITDGILETTLGRSIIHGLTYPFMNRGVDYTIALWFIANNFIKEIIIHDLYINDTIIATMNKLLKIQKDNKINICKIAFKPELFNTDQMLEEATKYASVFIKNTSYNFDNNFIKTIISETVKDLPTKE